MTIEQIENELLNKIAKLNGTHNVFQQGEIKQCELVLDMISKLRQDAVSGAVREHDWFGIDQCHSKCRKCGRIERDD